MKLSLTLALLSSLEATTAVAPAAPQGYGGRTIHVKAPASISEAIRGASYGDRIVVGPGTYVEQVLVKKSGIQLIGKGATIVPPTNPTANDCSDKAGFGSPTQAGICVAGEGIQTIGPVVEHQKVSSVRKPVEGVSITGFNVSGFSGANIFLYGAKNTRVFKNTLDGGPTYGFLTSGSVGTLVNDNVITMSSDAFGFVGICLDDLKKAEASKNTISGPHLVGLCIATSGALIRDNDVSNCCAGAFADPGVNVPKIVGNTLHHSLTQCGEFGSSGLTIDGATNSRVRGNKIENIHNDGPAAGVLIVDDPCTGPNIGLACIIRQRPAVASNNLVTRNSFSQNDLDIKVNTTGTGNVLKRNKCSTFQPTSLKPNPCRGY